ncbi:MAG: sulfatase family protein [Bacillota bacterium]
MGKIKNIFYLHTHDTGRYIEPYGYPAETPNLMNLAREGTLFRQAFSAAPTCSPSRAGMLTGRTPHSVGMYGLAHRGFSLHDYGEHLVQFLNKNGFQTVLCGMQHVAADKNIIGYDLILDREEQTVKDWPNVEKTEKYLSEREDSRPLFFSFGMEYTHREFDDIDDEIDIDYILPPADLPDDPDIRKDMAAFLSSVKHADQCLGRVLKAVEKAGMAENSLIIYTTDHGIAFPMMKSTLFDGGTGVSLIFKFPDNPKKGKTVDALVSQLDIFPTICDLFGLKTPDNLEGSSILPLLDDRTDKIREEVFAEVSYHAAYEPMRSVRTKRYKYIKFFGNYDQFVPSNIDDSPSKDFLLDNDFLEQKRDKEMLFDLYFDPQEKNNLIDNDGYHNIYQKLKSKLNKWMEKTDDPLLEGKVEKPKNAVVNKLSSLSAEDDDFE